MTDFTTSKRLFQLLCAPLLAFLPEASQTHHTDYRTHKFTTVHHILLTIFAHLIKAESANALLEELNDLDSEERERNLREMVGFNQFEFGLPVTLNQSSRVPSGCGLMPIVAGGYGATVSIVCSNKLKPIAIRVNSKA